MGVMFMQAAPELTKQMVSRLLRFLQDNIVTSAAVHVSMIIENMINVNSIVQYASTPYGLIRNVFLIFSNLVIGYGVQKKLR